MTIREMCILEYEAVGDLTPDGWADRVAEMQADYMCAQLPKPWEPVGHWIEAARKALDFGRMCGGMPT